jgi:ribonuclease HI
VRRLSPRYFIRQCSHTTKRECDALQQEYYADQDDAALPFARAVRFWPADHVAKPRDLFVHDARELDRYISSYARRPARMVHYDAPEDEILIYTSASCLDQHTTSATRSAASSCVFKPTGLHPNEPRSMAMRLERRGPTGQEYPQESNRAHLRAAIAALQCRQWHEEGWSHITIASDSEYLVEGITNWIEIWQQNGWFTSRDAGNLYDGDAVKNKDLWELLLWEVTEQLNLGVEVRFWLILHELNAEAHAEARMAAEVLKEEEYFYRMPYAEEMRFRR